MSHMSRIKTKMVEKEYILQALQDMGYTPVEGEAKVHGIGGESAVVEIRVRTHALGSEIGFRKSGDSYDVVGDWWGIFGVKQKDFMNQLNQRYAYHAAIAKLEEQGFTLVEEETQEKGQIHLVLRRMA